MSTSIFHCKGFTLILLFLHKLKDNLSNILATFTLTRLINWHIIIKAFVLALFFKLSFRLSQVLALGGMIITVGLDVIALKLTAQIARWCFWKKKFNRNILLQTNSRYWTRGGNLTVIIVIIVIPNLIYNIPTFYIPRKLDWRCHSVVIHQTN